LGSLKRVMAAGVSEDGAKLDISRAIADRKIGVRVTIADQSSDIQGTLTFGQFHVPDHLASEDFDWNNSRPLKPWATGPRHWKSDEWHSFSWRNRSISLIEVRTAEVIAWIEKTFDALAGEDPSASDDVAHVDKQEGAAGHAEQPTPSPEAKSSRGAKTRGIEDAIKQIWDNDIPQGLSPKERNNKIRGWLKDNECSLPKSDASLARAIQRVLKERSK
jgi:hypothetical protein